MHFAITLPFPWLRRRSTHDVLGWCALAGMVISSSTYPAFGKELTTTFTPLSMLFLSEAIGGLFISLSFGLVPMGRRILRLSRHDQYRLGCIGILSGFLGPLLWFMGLRETTAVNAELFSHVQMLFMVILSMAFLNDRLALRETIGLITVTLGVLIVGLRGFSNGLVLHLGDLLIIGSAFLYGIGAIIFKASHKTIRPEVAILTRSVCGIGAFFLLSPLLQHTLVQEFSDASVAVLMTLLFYGFLTKFIGIYSFHQAMERIPVAIVSSFSTLSIVGGVFFAHLYLGEHIAWYHTAGTIFIIAGIVGTQHGLRRQRHWRKTEEAVLRHSHRTT